MKRFALLATAVIALVLPTGVAAHPLGNFTVNKFSRIEAAGPRIYVHYVLDLAEIPTFQAGKLDAHGFARRIARGVRLTVNGRRARVVPVEVALAHPRGAAGLRTTRFEAILRGPRIAGRVDVRLSDGNYAGRIGWKEIVVGDTPSRSHELRRYAKDVLDITTVHASLVPGTVSKPRPHLSGEAARGRSSEGFASLVEREQLGFWVIVASLGAALFWGMAHALSPGHGKAIVTAYLVGRRGTARHAALLGVIVTATHTIGVFALGIVTLLLSQFIVPEQLYPWLTLVAGVLVIGIGASVLRARVRHHHHHHHHDHDLSRRSLLAVGVSGGLLPCPSALVVLLAAISLHRVAFGMLLVVAFSVGLALTITAIGLVAVLARRAFRRLSLQGRLVSLLPALSALVILTAGFVMTLHAIPKVR